MAVEARHQNLFPQQIISTNSEFVKVDQANGLNGYNDYMQMGCASLNNPWLAHNYIQPQIPLKAESGLTSNMNLAAAPRKRSRDSSMQYHLANFDHFPQDINSCGHNYISAQMQQQQLETDYIISEYTKRMKMEIVERQKQDVKLLITKMRGSLMRKLQEKEEEIITVAKLNSALQERVKNLYIENQIWKDVAQSKEATAQTLRNNLDSIMAHISINSFLSAADHEAESCCGSNDMSTTKEIGQGRKLALHANVTDKGHGEVDEPEGKLAGTAELGGSKSRMCRKCGEREACVLLLPCRHLCLCTVCGTTLQPTCPVCNSLMSATVHVSMV